MGTGLARELQGNGSGFRWLSHWAEQLEVAETPDERKRAPIPGGLRHRAQCRRFHEVAGVWARAKNGVGLRHCVRDTQTPETST